jgi:hypothetical protein
MSLPVVTVSNVGRWGEPARAPHQAALRNASGGGVRASAAVATGGSTWNIQAADTAATRTELAVLAEDGMLRRRFNEACRPATAGAFGR